MAKCRRRRRASGWSNLQVARDELKTHQVGLISLECEAERFVLVCSEAGRIYLFRLLLLACLIACLAAATVERLLLRRKSASEKGSKAKQSKGNGIN